jgi:acyl carrier protein
MSDLIATEIVTALHRIAPEADAAGIDRTAPLAEQLDLDSIDVQNLLAALSKRFAVEFPEVDVPNIRSFDDLAAYLAAHGAHA